MTLNGFPPFSHSTSSEESLTAGGGGVPTVKDVSAVVAGDTPAITTGEETEEEEAKLEANKVTATVRD